jgi:hypothetical protein
MTTLLERNRGVARRIEHPEPVAASIREILERGKQAQLLAGRDAAGVPFAPLAASTLRRREGSPTPLVPRGPSSRLIVGYVVTVRAEPGRLECSAQWPGLDWVKFHRSGTRRMPKRDPGGIREEDKAAAMAKLKEHCFG